MQVTLSQFKADIASKMKGTSIRQIVDFYGLAAGAAARMKGRIDPQEIIRTATLTTPFYDNVNDYPIAEDYDGMIDIRPQANRTSQPGLSMYTETTPRQFLTRLTPDSFSIRWNNMIRTLRAQVLPSGSVATLDTFGSASENGLWTAEGDASGLYTEELNFVQGSSALGMNLSGVTGLADIVNSTAQAVDLSAQRYQDASMLFVYIPVGFSSRFTSITLRRGSSATAYKQASVTTKADGTAFSDGWNFLLFFWNSAATVGVPNDALNTYRRVGLGYSVGTAIPGVLVDSWTDSLGVLYEMEYYSQYMFRSSTGVWKQTPDDDTDLVNVGPLSYEILKAEMMIDVTQIIRSGNVKANELADWQRMLNGQPQNRYLKDRPDNGLYANYLLKFPSSRIVNVSRTYDFDI